MKTEHEMTAHDVTNALSREFKKGVKSATANPSAYRRAHVIESIKNSYDLPLVSIYWQGVLWALDHRTDYELHLTLSA